MRIHRMALVGIVFVLLLAGAVESKEVNFEAEEWFEKGLVHYKIGHFTGARSDFQHVLDLPRNRRSSAAQLMLAKCFYKLEEYDQAIQEAESLLEDYPETRYLLDARLLMGDCRLRQNELLRAGELYVGVLEDPSVPIAQEEKAAHRVVLVSSMLPEEKLHYLRAFFKHRQMEELLLYKGGEADLSRGEIESARSKLEALLKGFPGSPFTARARELLEESKTGRPVSETVGCLCPLSGVESGAGQDLRDGIQLAQERFGSRIGLRIEDTGSDVIGAIKAAQKLINELKVMAIIGPVFGPATVAAAAVADCERTPLLAPTATEDRLVHIGPYIFQLNTTPRMQGMNTANYAINRLGLYRLAILASTDPFGKDMASGFLQEADQQGGYVHIQEFFFPETKDFTAQLDHIQEVARKLRRRQSEAGAVDVPENAPLDTIDGILVAADPDAIPLIASQLATRKVQTRLLGGDGWHSEGVVRDGGDYVEGAIFAAGYDENTEPCAQFIKAFAERYGRHPTKVAAFGYDAMMLINRVYAESGSRTRVSIRDHLAEVADYVGASGAISFEKGHANCKSHILQIREGHFVPAEESE